MTRGLNRDQIKNWLADAANPGELYHRTGFPSGRWQTFIDDLRRFIADGWLDRAIKLEWLDLECFGVDPELPFDNPAPGRTGLVPALNGRVVAGLHPDYATIKNLADEDGCLHSRWLQNVSRHKQQKPLVLIWNWKAPTTTPTIGAGEAWIIPPPRLLTGKET
jgi:hypothetical protein